MADKSQSYNSLFNRKNNIWLVTGIVCVIGIILMSVGIWLLVSFNKISTFNKNEQTPAPQVEFRDTLNTSATTSQALLSNQTFTDFKF